MSHQHSQKKILLIGSKGQLGQELCRTAHADLDLYGTDIDELDITDKKAVLEFISKHKPDWIINAAAYTNVDRAEQERDLAFSINRDGALFLARAARENNARLIQISTDYIFNGKKNTPYTTEDIADPLSVYGASKYAGEIAVLKELGNRSTIVRTAWLYSVYGRNFVKTILHAIKVKDEIQVIDDQTGTPTWAYGLANTLWKMVEKGSSGIYNWTDGGATTWYDLAVAIQQETTEPGLHASANTCNIRPVRTQDYPASATRPGYSVLDKTGTFKELGVEAPHWRKALREMLSGLKLNT
ncbi:MAG TPA: dTDP-4-dehydrorhamnose reductase [Gammaproteobacteria bacterium]|nr:dTDP-4-dehydrorhamnose reductase [Gammaproteobacteria bacterium]